MAPLQIIFMGTAELASPALKALLESSAFKVLAVVTQPDRPKGRELKTRPSPVKQVAQEAGVPVSQPPRARDETFIRELKERGPELIIVAAYGQILPPDILELPRLGCLNVHASLLPKYRGAAPIQWALLKMDAGLDTGPILAQRITPISLQDTAATLHDRLALLGAELLLATIPGYVDGKIFPRPQPTEGISYARKIKKEDGHLDWSQPAHVLRNRIRAFTLWPGAFTFQPGEAQGHLLKIWEAEVLDRSGGVPGEILEADKSGLVIACGAQALKILTVQREGGKRMSARDFLAGHPLEAGQRLT
ncbi:MAG: methionyl-tRNA formyltransferase [Verrucomicrobia bacterium]|nr:MAG: methionyl-tRNA formyltransferase [Verrucomicrobiota bacterium]